MENEENKTIEEEKKNKLNIKDIGIFSTIFALPVTILYIMGLSFSLDFPIYNFINFNDYLNLSLSLLAPFLIYNMPYFLLILYIIPIRNYLNRFIKPTKKEIISFIVMLVFYLIFIYLYYNYTNNSILFNNTMIIAQAYVSIFKPVENNIADFIIFLNRLFFLIMAIIISHSIGILFKYNFVQKKLTILKFTLIFVTPIYIMSIILLGFSHGLKIKTQKINPIQIETIDNSILQGDLVISLDKYLIIKHDSLKIQMIKTDQIKSLKQLKGFEKK